MNAIPVTEIDVTIEWLRALLGPDWRWPAVGSPGVRLARIGAEYGQMGTLYRAVFEPPPSHRPSSMVVKFSEDLREAEQEMGFYRDFGPRFLPNTAHFYAGRADPERGRAVLCLEDLTSAVQGDAERGATLEQMHAIAEVVGKIHGDAWGRASPGAHAWLSEWEPIRGNPSDMHEKAARFLARHGEKLDARQRRLVTGLGSALISACERLSRHPQTLVHNDLHLENILFTGPDARQPIILDWQTVCLGPGVVDVARTLVECVSVEARRRCQGEVVARYVDALHRHGVRGHGVEAVEAGLEDAWTALWATIVCSDFVNRPAADTTARQARGIAMGIDRVSRALVDSRTRRASRDATERAESV